MTDYLDYIVNSYLWAVVMVFGSIYLFINTIKNPIPNNLTSPLQENSSGIVGGIVFFILGFVIIFNLLIFHWWGIDKMESTKKYDLITSIVFLIGSVGGLLFIYLKKEYEPKDRWRKIIIVSGCSVLIPLSIYILLSAW